MIASAIRRPVTIAMLALGAAMVGLASWHRMPFALVPDGELPRLEIIALWRGASPELVEGAVTAPAEGIARQLRGVRDVSSLSSDVGGVGMARVTVRFARGAAMRFTRLELNERLAAFRRTLPPGVWGPVVLPYVPPALQAERAGFLSFTLAGGTSADALRALVERAVLPAARSIPGVSDAALDEPAAEEVRIAVAPLRAEARRVTWPTLLRAVGEPGVVRDVGVVRSGALERTVRMAASMPGASDALAAPPAPLTVSLGALPLGAGVPGGGRLAELAAIRSGYAEPGSLYRVDGAPAVSFTIYRRPGTDALRLGALVRSRIAALPALRTPGLRLLVDADEGSQLAARLARFGWRALGTGALIALVLAAWLRSWRATVAVLANVATGQMLAITLLGALGFSLDLPTLGGLAVGAVLATDTTVTVLHHCRQRLARLPPRGRTPARVLRSAARTSGVMAASTLAAVVVLVPLAYLPAELRLLYLPFASSLGASLVAGLSVALLVLPAVVAHSPALAGPPAAFGRARRRARRSHGRVLVLSLRYPAVATALALALTAWSGARLMGHSERSRAARASRAGAGLPTGAATAIEVGITLPAGTPLRSADAAARPVERRARRLAGVTRIATRVQPGYASVMLYMGGGAPEMARALAARDSMLAAAALVGGAEVRVTGYGTAFRGGGGVPSYTIPVLGYDYEVTSRIASLVAARLASEPRVRRVDTTAADAAGEVALSELELRPDSLRLAALGVSAAVLAQEVAAVLGGVQGPEVREGRDVLPVWVERASTREPDTRALDQVLVLLPSGPVRVGAVATLVERASPARIAREDQRYQRLVRYEFRGPPEMGDRLYRTVLRTTRLPPGFSLGEQNAGDWKRPGSPPLLSALAAAVVLLSLVTAAALERPRAALVVLATVAASLGGTAALIVLTGAPLTNEVALGAAVTAGVVASRAILMVHEIVRLGSRGTRTAGAIVAAARTHGGCIALRGLVATAGIFPLAIGMRRAEERVWGGAALALLGGLPAATLSVLLLTPALYLLLAHDGQARTCSVCCRGV